MVATNGSDTMKDLALRETTIEVIPREEWDVVSQETKALNARKHNRQTFGVSPCHLCGQTISNKAYDASWFVHMTVDGDLLPVAVKMSDSEGSQGYFPIGSACAKRIPKEYKTRFREGGNK